MKKTEKYKSFFIPKETKQKWVNTHTDYTEYPTNFIEFCLSDEYLGMGEDVYDSLLDLGYKVFSSRLTEVIIIAGIGSGKSYFAQLGTIYILYTLMCLKDPHKYLGLSKDKPIEMINMGLNATQAKDVIFTGIRNLMVDCEWFKIKACQLGGGIDLLKTEISIFTGQKNLHYNSNSRRDIFKLISGNSQDTAPIGRNLYVGGLDEAAFYLENSDTSVAEDIYDAINARIASRFGQRGMTFVISSPKFENDFVDRKFQEGLQNPEIIFTYQSTTWHFKDRDRLSDDIFVFDHKNFRIIPDEEFTKLGIILNKENIFNLKFNTPKDEYLWIIPMDYYKAFKKAPEKATRDLGAKIIGNIEGFIKSRAFIDLAYGKSENRVDEYGIWNSDNPVSGQVFAHIDLALNRTDKSDCAGIAVSRVKGLNDDGMPIIEVLFVEQIFKEEGAVEIQLSDVRLKLIGLKKMGWEFGLVTLDGYQSIDTMQILMKNGIKADYLSLDTNLAPYEGFREALYDERVLLPALPIIKEELQGLELVNGSKVDHPRTGCFTGDTRIALANGTCPTMEELVGIKEFDIYSINKEGICITKARNCRVTKETTELVEILLDNYSVIRCTPEHLFMTIDGDWVQAQNLTQEISIMPLYRSVSFKGGNAEYERVWCPIRKERVLTHKLAMGLPINKVVHHKDLNKRNNAIDNLEMMTLKEHSSYHGKEFWEIRKGQMKKGYDKLTHTQKHSERMKKLWEDGVYGKKDKKCSIEGCENKHQAKGLCDMHYQRAKRRGKLKVVESYHNHRILGIQKIILDTPIKVYDITVPETENFALANGVFVHNSKDVADAVAGSVYNAIKHGALNIGGGGMTIRAR